VNTADGELQSGPGRASLGLGTSLSTGFTSSAHCSLQLLVKMSK